MEVEPPDGVALAMPVHHMENPKVEIHLEVVLKMARNLEGAAHLVMVLKMVQLAAYDPVVHQ